MNFEEIIKNENFIKNIEISYLFYNNRINNLEISHNRIINYKNVEKLNKDIVKKLFNIDDKFDINVMTYLQNNIWSHINYCILYSNNIEETIKIQKYIYKNILFKKNIFEKNLINYLFEKSLEIISGKCRGLSNNNNTTFNIKDNIKNNILFKINNKKFLNWFRTNQLIEFLDNNKIVINLNDNELIKNCLNVMLNIHGLKLVHICENEYKISLLIDYNYLNINIDKIYDLIIN